MNDDRGNASRRTTLLFLGLVGLVGLIVWPSLAGRIRYAQVRSELAAIGDAAAGTELAAIGKMFTTLPRIVGPTVVNVTSKRRVRTIADEIASLRGLKPAGATSESVGSGVILAENGVIVTNYHVVASSDTIEVALADGRKFTADLLGADAATDLAVLRIDARNLPVATWGDSDALDVGEMVWAIGNPFGLDRTITRGIVSAKGRRGVVESPYQEFLQTDAAINPGNSGGPLVDVHGRVVGITTAIVGRDFTGIGFAIPSNTARQVCDAILETGSMERGYLGMALRPTPPDVAGVFVAGVEPGSPAARAGVRPGDLVVRFDDEEVGDPASLVLLLTRAPIGERVTLDVVRDGASIAVTVEVGRRPRQ
jgi:serine protease Do